MPKLPSNLLFDLTILLALSASWVQGQEHLPSKPALGRDQPAVIEDLKVYLPQYSAPGHASCSQKLQQAACQANAQALTNWQQAESQMKTGTTLLNLHDYPGARQHCIAAFELLGGRAPTVMEERKKRPLIAELPDVSPILQDCIDQAEHGQDQLDLENVRSLMAGLDLYLEQGDLDRARGIRDELRKKHAELPAYCKTARTAAYNKITELPKRNWSAGWAWLRSRLLLLCYQIVVAMAGILLLYLLLRAYRGARNSLRRGYSRAYTRWFVQGINDDARQAGSGALMDALSTQGNALLRTEFRPPELLLVPPGFGGPQGDGVWWNFFSQPRPAFEIERLPLDRIGQHEFVLDDALDEVQLKIAGQEISGLVGLAKNVSRWFNKGMPTVQGAVLKTSSPSGTSSWAVRLTASSSPRWVSWLVDARGRTVGSLTVSVYSSTEEQEFVDAVGLAAQRAAFKLFYRLADPDKDPDEITAIAAFHQGIILLRRYL